MSEMIQDPEMDEVVSEFCNESDELCEELLDLIDEIEESKNYKKLEEFGQKIDRIMGAALSLDLQRVGSFCKLGKQIGYKASQSNDEKLLEISTAIMADNVDIIQALISSIKKDKKENVESINLESFKKRLDWLFEKFGHISRASVSAGGETHEQEDIDQMLKNLGL